MKYSSALHDTFQFAWTNDLELLSNIGKSMFYLKSLLFRTFLLAIWTVEEPLLFLYDSNERKYGIYPLALILNENIDMKPILNYITSNYSQIIQHAGNTWSKRLLRPFWELYRTIIGMFIEAPMISMLVMGLPASVLSIVCYCICCLPNETIMDDNMEEEYETQVASKSADTKKPEDEKKDD